MEWKERIWQEAGELQDILRGHQSTLHRSPEVGFALKQTCAYVKEQLQKMGYTPLQCGKAGWVVTVGGHQPGKVFLLRADMDALPIQEETLAEDAAGNGYMHACGHDFHTSMLLGAAALLKKHEQEIKGAIKLMFQPAEELLEGARDMIEAGVLLNPAVDGALMVHVMAGLPLPTGTCIVSSPGVSAPAADYFTIEIQGKGCHGSSPNTGIDPLTAAAHVLIGLQELTARELGTDEVAVLTIGSVNGGEAANVIPDRVTMKGTLRAFREDVRERLKKRMEEIAVGIAGAFRARATVTFGSGCPTLVNDRSLSEFVAVQLKELLGETYCHTSKELEAQMAEKGGGKMSGSEDFAYVSHEVPSVMLALAAGEPSKGYLYPQHHPKVQFDKEVLSVGAAIYAYTALTWLEKYSK
ncbi:MAG: amidohydrolase [Lachnospiraceae bacterium]|nr:amidohydrolase [Lachnospiraceae bacterium]